MWCFQRLGLKGKLVPATSCKPRGENLEEDEVWALVLERLPSRAKAEPSSVGIAAAVLTCLLVQLLLGSVQTKKTKLRKHKLASHLRIRHSQFGLFIFSACVAHSELYPIGIIGLYTKLL